MTDARSREWLRNVPIAHRGLHDLARGLPENSLGAFEAAVDRGFAIELDVHLLADGQVVVFHDVDLMRLTGQAGVITDQTSNSLQSLRLCGTDFRIPLFSEVLSLVRGRRPILVEIKSDGEVGSLESALLTMLNGYDGPIAIQSFNPSTVEWYKTDAPHIVRGQLSGTFNGDKISYPRKLLLRSLLLSVFGRPHFFGMEVAFLTWLPSRIVKALGFPVLTWTVKSEQQEQLARLNADNIIFEQFIPNVAKKSGI